VALNRPAHQPSTYSNWAGYYTADLANDGGRDTLLAVSGVPKCVASQLETNPWWSVDLGLPLQVQEVFLTNRDDAGEYRFQSTPIQCINSVLFELCSAPLLSWLLLMLLILFFGPR